MTYHSRRIRLFGAVMLFSALPVILPLHWLSHSGMLAKEVSYVASGLNAFWVVTVIATMWRREVSMSRAVKQAEGLLCKRCGYDLHTTREFQCPECGEHFDPHELPKYWKKVLRLKDWPSAPGAKRAPSRVQSGDRLGS